LKRNLTDSRGERLLPERGDDLKGTTTRKGRKTIFRFVRFLLFAFLPIYISHKYGKTKKTEIFKR